MKHITKHMKASCIGISEVCRATVDLAKKEGLKIVETTVRNALTGKRKPRAQNARLIRRAYPILCDKLKIEYLPN